jgi:calcineurin-like phosphoesterase family protein
MSKFYCADPHFGHTNICKFTKEDGSKLRPWDDIQEHDEALVKNWNEIVHPKDTVYILGDVCMSKNKLPILDRLFGRKVLVKGNHDIFDLKEYVKYFADIRAYIVNTKEKFICSHIPIHPENFGRMGMNVHGHTHGQHVVKPEKMYFCVSMENINYTPIEHSEMLRQCTL